LAIFDQIDLAKIKQLFPKWKLLKAGASILEPTTNILPRKFQITSLPHKCKNSSYFVRHSSDSFHPRKIRLFNILSADRLPAINSN
jgi:hypothetical protein